MKEITRIHIAKVAYDIELDAKKDIQKYINALEQYAEEQEILDDIEIRITELLAERGVSAGGVITKGDVAAVRERLGEPSDFAPDDAGSVGMVEVGDSPRRLYRDRDSAVLGGVLAGMARFFRIDPIWVRLGFLVLLIGSGGTAAVLYLVLWLAVPPAKTSAEKLQMRGQPVTLPNIKQMSLVDEDDSSASNIVQQVLRFGIGVMLLLGAIGALAVTLFVGLGITLGTTDNSPIASWRPTENWWTMVALVLFVLAGLLLAILSAVLASAVFRGRWGNRMGVTVVSIIVAGMLVFLGGVGTVWFGIWQQSMQISSSRQTSRGDLPSDFKVIKSLTIDAGREAYDLTNVQYIVSSQAYYEIEALPGVKPQFTVGDDKAGKLSISNSNIDGLRYGYGYAQTQIKIYGPALESVNIQNGMLNYIGGDKKQKALKLSGRSHQINLEGTYETVNVLSQESTHLELGRASIENLRVKMTGGTVTAGVVRTLDVEQNDVCAASEDRSEGYLRVQAVSSGTITYNDSERAAKDILNNCGTVTIGERDYNEGREE